MKIVLARIDDRFIHGQVLTRWIKIHAADRIIVVSNEVAQDEMRKTLILSVAPSNVKASAVSISKMAKAFHSPRYEDTTAMLLFENPGDIVSLIEAGVPIEIVNVGGMRFENNRRQITKSVSVTEKDIKSFEQLHELGVKLELRQLPSDSSEDFMQMLRNATKS
ncbi:MULTISPECIES: mannose/fructose/sorbose PTS transporter subunit IIB [Bacillus]|jgi:fructose-specific PTS system IIB component|uniref:Phosphotransferase system (PTS) fructose-specific enzyme IIB component n=1 Tax=Bacillus licheniformis (strain ATCC 14580 / DSM 13 / JCM 2505 / CCUG 7422 / NBRC 12200 / NCIMB 9375 / NCTC 10341 / NRRL NRS-1264 / Gibson 46) TaxID=279010 RepID=Q65GW4_BACLD|nr:MULTISPECIES: mannose/fructose/sorbose PTS transporter subunit IIB [Bacillus]AAU24334.1 phosphotransferase system (PTS) fructose-specific enzyme IIB component [Bacillus licheniformis DSM 13 = ATCC 14580]AAU41700.1 trigger enzyme fructose-specific phosphotransferase enzyme EIIB component LevE [Bacillus licheniformis DSM 13 = ATCC 14580]AOP15998.1 Protein-N(pi)-phosphohistidine--sugar phosphotransferase [Bacillus licheniformis]ATI76938.1 PTS fructose transporter subunit IIB [Bacillus lichenifo